YLIVLLKSTASGGALFTLGTTVSEVPISWDILSRRVTDTLQSTVVHWPTWAWWLVLACLVWGGAKYRRNNFILTGLICVNVVSAFAFALWPFPRYAGQFLPFFAVLFAAAILLAGEKLPGRLIIVPALVVAIALPGLVAAIRFAETTPFAYRESD